MEKIKKDKSKVQIEQQFIYLIMNIIEKYPQYTLAQHLNHFLRKKGELQESYHWSDELFLKKVEDYYDELDSYLGRTPIEE